MTSNEIRYVEYINKHKRHVETAWMLLRKSLNFYDEEYHTIDRLIEIHDYSKFSEQEFGRYRQFFFPESGETWSEEAFQIGWNHHQKTNPHHWQYWVMYRGVGDVVALEMPYVYIVEMVCDWLAMSMHYHTSVKEWFNDNLDRMLLHEETMKILEPLIDIAEEVLVVWLDAHKEEV